MRILGIETSTRTGSVALVQGEGVIAEYTLNSKETHTARLMPMIDHILKDAHLTIRQMDAVAVSLGPGSFTGLRIGIATAKGLCLALRKPLIGISTLDALAHNIGHTSQLICPLLDARKGEVYTAIYRYRLPGKKQRLEKLSKDMVLSLDKLLSKINASTVFLGDVFDSYRDLIGKRLGKKASFAPPALNFPRAANVAVLGLEKLQSGEEEPGLSEIEPLYVRRPEAEVQWEKKHPKRKEPT
ncbi:MAG: tRNA (adenosine(37)-N6)-threonylcarbamoyltransferase complex dimerization subunit type 1 TsaB [Nitrospirae bacterium]|nr:tRNA (adenosine(37)-N6)-threonylcarbamoyltransferase complex dimerization subunit type 1 TsaB [Nitrospirota bacterium]